MNKKAKTSVYALALFNVSASAALAGVVPAPEMGDDYLPGAIAVGLVAAVFFAVRYFRRRHTH